MQIFTMYDLLFNLIRELYPNKDYINLHSPVFHELEKKIVSESIDSTFVSSIGKNVDLFEKKIKNYIGCKYAVAFVNATSALHIALLLSGVEKDHEVITQSLTFIAPVNAISYCGANPVFVDVDRKTLSIAPESLENFLTKNCKITKDNFCQNILTKKIIKSCILVHTFGFPGYIKEIKSICKKFNLKLIEDSSEALGSQYFDKQVGSNSDFNIFSFNGNKIITTGGGGVLTTNNKIIALKAKHMSTTARMKSKTNFKHNLIGYNYRMPNINASLGLGQLNFLKKYIRNKRDIAKAYQSFGIKYGFNFLEEPVNTYSNYWLNTLITKNSKERNKILNLALKKNIHVRKCWTPIHKLLMYKNCQKDEMINTKWLSDRILNFPSGINLDT